MLFIHTTYEQTSKFKATIEYSMEESQKTSGKEIMMKLKNKADYS